MTNNFKYLKKIISTSNIRSLDFVNLVNFYI